MKKTALICFVKTPGISPLKTRLASSIGEEAALETYLKLIACVEETFTELEAHHFATIWAVNEASAMTDQLWQGREIWVQPDGSLGEKLAGIEERASAHFESWMFIGSDTPGLGTKEILMAREHLASSPWVTGPASDGGFYLWASKRSLPKDRWLSTPYSSANTLESLLMGLMNVSQLAPLPDLDSLADLNDVIHSLESFPGRARRELLTFLDSLASTHK